MAKKKPKTLMEVFAEEGKATAAYNSMSLNDLLESVEHNIDNIRTYRSAESAAAAIIGLRRSPKKG